MTTLKCVIHGCDKDAAPLRETCCDDHETQLVDNTWGAFVIIQSSYGHVLMGLGQSGTLELPGGGYNTKKDVTIFDIVTRELMEESGMFLEEKHAKKLFLKCPRYTQAFTENGKVNGYRMIFFVTLKDINIDDLNKGVANRISSVDKETHELTKFVIVPVTDIDAKGNVKIGQDNYVIRNREQPLFIGEDSKAVFPKLFDAYCKCDELDLYKTGVYKKNVLMLNYHKPAPPVTHNKVNPNYVKKSTRPVTTYHPRKKHMVKYQSNNRKFPVQLEPLEFRHTPPSSRPTTSPPTKPIRVVAPHHYNHRLVRDLPKIKLPQSAA